MSVPKRRLVISAPARSDLGTIRRYSLQRWSLRQYNDDRAKLTVAMDRLTQFPELGAASPLRPPGLRAHSIEQHVVYYLVSDEAVTVLRILHVKMDAAAQLGP